jgi:glycosyl transferase family 25
MRTFEPFDRIKIINLPERTDRRRGMDKELAKVGLLNDPRVSYFQAIRPSDAGAFTSVGARGVYESQRAILKEAACAGDSVLILEDDCFFVDGTQYREFSTDWEIFYGGYTAHNPNCLQTSDIVGAHMMGFSTRGAQLISAYFDDLTVEGIHPPIDGAYVWFRRQHPEIPTHFASPPLAGQRSSRSDIAPLKWFDRNPATRGVVNFLRGLKRPGFSGGGLV